MKRNRLGNPRSPLCGQLGPDDGVDPRVLFGREDRKQHTHRKDRQLCGQVRQALILALDSLGRRRSLHGVFVEDVSPAPDASRLRVTVGFIEPRSMEEATAIVDELRRSTGTLRWEIGAAISRKRVPELCFELTDLEVADVD